MKRTALVALCLLSLSLPLAAAPDEKVPTPKSEGAKKPKKKEKKKGDRSSRRTEGVVKFLTKELDLDPKQQEQVRKIFKEVMEEQFKAMRRPPWEMNEKERKKMRKGFENLRLTIAKKISKILTKAQRREFEVLVEQFDSRAQRHEQAERVRKDVSELFNPKPKSKRILMGKAERALLVDDEEAAVIMPYVEKVIDARIALWEGRRVRRKDLLNAARAKASKKEIVERVKQIRAAENFQRLELMATQQRLRELLSVPQEARFVAMGLVD